MSEVRKYVLLDGNWEFAYRKEAPDLQKIEFPRESDYEAKMHVPGYWDDYTDLLRYTKFWSRDCKFNPEYRSIDYPMGGGKPADASLPYLLGAGWYKKSFVAGQDWDQRTVILHVGGVALEAWVWLNGQFIGYHLGHLTPFEVSLNKALKPGESNELIIAVANTRTDRTGCSIRGFKGKSAGITRSVYLQVSAATRISDCYVRTNAALDQLIWEVGIDQKKLVEPLYINWQIIDPESNQTVAQGSVDAVVPKTGWTTETFGLKKWSDKQPKLYKLHLILSNNDYVIDEHEQSF